MSTSRTDDPARPLRRRVWQDQPARGSAKSYWA